MVQRSNLDANPQVGTTIRITKRKRETDAAIEELSNLDREAKKHRIVHREEPDVDANTDEPEAHFTMLMRRHIMSLDIALRAHWVCVCQKCSGLSVRLSMPQRKKGSEIETCFEVFFGVRSLLATTLQEAKITVKDVQNYRSKSASEPSISPDFAQICQCIAESLDQQHCLHLALEDGLFKRLRPQPKTFGDIQMLQTLSLSALFTRQQELRGGSSALPLKGKRILAVTLATALLPYLETPWIRPSFNHSKIQFPQPLQDGELPNITKPFLSMEHIPTLFSDKVGNGSGQTEPFSSKHMVHPNASVLALGILLCELHYCTPMELMQSNTETIRNVNTDYYTSLDILKNLEVDAGLDYYLATKACLQWEYYPTGEPADFESASVQRLFYQNVVKRLEAEIFKSWRLRSEDLGSLDARENELCWGVIGREVFRRCTSKARTFVRPTGETATPMPMTSGLISPSYTPSSTDMALKMPNRLSQCHQTRRHLTAESMDSQLFFDASHQTFAGQDSALSERWMESFLSLIYCHVDSFDIAKAGTGRFEPVRIAILDSGFDSENPLIMSDNQRLDPRVKDARSFVHQTGPFDFQDEIGHGTHALGLLLKVATCAEIFIAKVASRDAMNSDSYGDIAKAINHAVREWNVDIISMSFGIREYSEPIKEAISNALHSNTLMFAAASNDGGNSGRAFPAKYPSVFCIHSTDGNGNPSTFNPTADEKDVNFSLLGEHVRSHWPAGKSNHFEHVNTLSGTSVATPIAAGLAASILSLVRQQELNLVAAESELLGSWLKDSHSMDLVLKSMVQRRQGYDYIMPQLLFDKVSSRECVYSRIRDIKRNMYN